MKTKLPLELSEAEIQHLEDAHAGDLESAISEHLPPSRRSPLFVYIAGASILITVLAASSGWNWWKHYRVSGELHEARASMHAVQAQHQITRLELARATSANSELRLSVNRANHRTRVVQNTFDAAIKAHAAVIARADAALAILKSAAIPTDEDALVTVRAGVLHETFARLTSIRKHSATTPVLLEGGQ